MTVSMQVTHYQYVAIGSQDPRGRARGVRAGDEPGVAAGARAGVRARRRGPALLPHAHAPALPAREVSYLLFIYLQAHTIFLFI